MHIQHLIYIQHFITLSQLRYSIFLEQRNGYCSSMQQWNAPEASYKASAVVSTSQWFCETRNKNTECLSDCTCSTRRQQSNLPIWVRLAFAWLEIYDLTKTKMSLYIHKDVQRWKQVQRQSPPHVSAGEESPWPDDLDGHAYHSEPSQGATTLVLVGTVSAMQEEGSPRVEPSKLRDMCLGTSSCCWRFLCGLSPLVEEARSWRRGRFGDVSLSKHAHTQKEVK